MKRNILAIAFLLIAVCCVALVFVSCGTGGETPSETTDVSENDTKPNESEQNETVAETVTDDSAENTAEDTAETAEETSVYDITDEEIANNKLMENMNMTFAESLKKAFELYTYTPELSFPLKKGVATATNELYPEGTEYDEDGWSLSEEYDVKEASKLQCNLGGTSMVYSMVFYNENHEFISGISSSTESKYGYRMKYLVADVPENAAYVRFASFVGCRENSVDICSDIGGKLHDYWQKRIDYDISGLKVSCMGDSITEGFNGYLEDYDAFKNKTIPDISYSALLGEYYGVETQNYGICSLSAKTYLDEYNNNSFDIKDSDVITIMLGTNYVGATEYASEYEMQKKYYDELIQKVMSDMKSTATLILCTPPPTSVKDPQRNEHVRKMCEVVYELAEEHDLSVIDTFNDCGFISKFESITMPFDTLHYSEIGNEALATFIGTGIEKVLQEKTQNVE